MSGEGSILQSLLTNAWGWVLILLFFNGAIVVHELGHFLAAKWRGLKVERFSIFGLGPKIVGWRGKDGVEYCFCWIPFGAFVALPQLADMKSIEGEGEEAASLPPISYADKMIVAFAGPFFNIILALVLAAGVWFFGTPTNASMETNVIGYVSPTIDVDSETTVISPASKAGLQPGDRILAVDGKTVEDFIDISMLIATGSGRDHLGNPKAELLIERDGEPMTVEVFPVMMTFNERSGRDLRRIGIRPAEKVIVGYVMENSPGKLAGLKTGDVIESFNSTPLLSLFTLNDYINEHPDEAVTLNIQRNGQSIQLSVKPEAVALTRPLVRIAKRTQADHYIDIMPSNTGMAAADKTSGGTRQDLVVLQAETGESFAPAIKAGMNVTGVNGKPVDSLQALLAAVNGLAPNADSFMLNLNGGVTNQQIDVVSAELIPPETRAMIGFGLQGDFKIAHPAPPEQFVEAVKMIGRVLGSLLSPSSDIGFKDLNGAVGIGRLVHSFSNPAYFETKWDGFRAALAFAVILNVNLALLNLLPIPVLDGGHMTIATISKLMGRPMPRAMIEAATGAFVVMLFGLMIYITLFDSLDWVGDSEAKARELRMESYRIQPAFPQPEK